jgi:hypothetical protein
MSFAESFSNFASEARQWLRRHSTREGLADAVRTGAWVVPLTILIWIYAEQQQRTDEPKVPVLVKLHSSDPDRIITALRRSDEQPLVDLRGPKSAIEALKAELSRAGENPLIDVEVPNTYPPGIHDLNIDTEIARAGIFKKYGVEVTSVLPSIIQVQIDTLVNAELEVRPSPNANIDSAVFEPKTIKIRLPSDLLSEAQRKLGNNLAVYAEIPASGDLAAPGVPHEKIPLRIDLPAELQGEKVTIVNGPTVNATYIVKGSFVDDQIQSLIIRHSYAGELDKEWVVEGTNASILNNVDIRGPRDACERVKNRAATNDAPVPYATLNIDVIDKPKAGKTSDRLVKKLEYSLGEPDVSPKDPNRTIEVTIRKRAAADQ